MNGIADDVQRTGIVAAESCSTLLAILNYCEAQPGVLRNSFLGCPQSHDTVSHLFNLPQCITNSAKFPDSVMNQDQPAGAHQLACVFKFLQHMFRCMN